MLDNLLTLTLASVMGPGVIENPKISTLEHGSEASICYANEVRKQAPEGLLGEGEIYVMGPSERRDVAPPGSVLEIMGVAPNSKSTPKYLNLSIWFETPDHSEWQSTFYPSGGIEFTASGVTNPAKVFERVQYRYLFDLDLRPCVEL